MIKRQRQHGLSLPVIFWLLALSSTTQSVVAYDFSSDGLYFNVIGNGCVEVTYQSHLSVSNYNGLRNITIPSTVKRYSDGYSGVTYMVTAIGDDAFLYCPTLSSVVIPNTVTKIGHQAFRLCEALTNVTIPNTVKTISQSAFGSCHNLKNLTLPNSLTLIGEFAFSGCNSLTNVYIPSSVKSIGNAAFGSCQNLTSIVVDAGNNIYDSRDNCNAIIETVSNTLVESCSSTTIPSSVTAIGDYGFYACRGLTSLSIPNSITRIGSHAFANSKELVSVDIPNSVTSIPEFAFAYCSSLESVNIPNTLTYISAYAFEDCAALKSVVLPKTLTSIRHNAFENCTALTKIYVVSDIPPGCNNTTFLGVPTSSCLLYVQQGSVAKYKEHSIFKDFSNILPYLYFEKSEQDININHPFQLQVSCQEPIDMQSVTWKSGYWKIATVDEEGVVTAKSVGKIDITASIPLGYTASCKVNTHQLVTYIDMPLKAQVYVGGQLNLTASVIPTNATNKTLTWKSSDTSVATVDQDGNVKALKIGKSTITASATDASGIASACELLVTGIKDISLNKTRMQLYIGAHAELEATITPSDVINKTLTWKSSNPDVVTVDQDGKITAVKLGKATITVAATDGSGVSASCDVMVTGITALALNKTNVPLYAGGKETLSAIFTPQDVIVKTLTWKSSDPSVATVKNGVVTAAKTGMTTITATATDGSNASGWTVVTVDGINDIELNKTSTQLYVSGRETLKATVTPSDALENQTLKWMSTNPSIAHVGQDGTLSAKSVGTATITVVATDGTDASATCDVTVLGITDIKLNKTSLTMKPNERETLQATITPSDVINITLTWKSSDWSVASVDQSGHVTAKKNGKATITATAVDGSGVSASCAVTVSDSASVNDVNGDGEVNVGDVNVILNEILARKIRKALIDASLTGK